MSVQNRTQKGLNQQLGEIAMNIEEHGKRVWHEREPQFREGARRAGYIVAIVINAALLYIMNNLLTWEPPYVTADFAEVLGVINVSISATTLANLVFLTYDPRWFRHLAQIGLSLLSIRVLYTLFIVYPFDLGAGVYDMWLRMALIACAVCAAIGVLVETIQLLIGRYRD